MKKTLLITGILSEKSIKEFLKKIKFSDEVIVHSISNIDVASFLTPEILLRNLSKNKEKLKDMEKIIVPGTTRGDFSIVRKKLGVPCFKGSKCYLNLKEVLESKIELSEKISADEFLNFNFRKKVELKLRKNRAKKFSMKIGSGKNAVFLNGIPHIVAEINNAPMLKKKEIEKIAQYYVNSGAEIIDIGMTANEDNSKKIPEMIEILRKKVDVALSIDTLNGKEILTAIDSGIDLILSLDFSNYKIVKDIDIPAVIIPRDEKGNVPVETKKRVKLIEILMNNLKEKNFDRKKIIIDLILQPINFGFSESLNAFMEFRKIYPKIPMLMGFGNVTELMDVDSVGINGLLTGIASELNIDLLLTTEGSFKTKGCIKEISTAIKMMYLSKIQKQSPKDLSIDLLVLKEKEKFELKIEKNLKTIKVKNREVKESLEDCEFRIFIDHERREINVIYYYEKKSQLRFIGKKCEEIYKKILSRKLIKSLSHGAYLGKELEKAEIALKLGRNYIQDEPLFK